MHTINAKVDKKLSFRKCRNLQLTIEKQGGTIYKLTAETAVRILEKPADIEGFK